MTNKLYLYYYNYTPIGVFTKSETIIFNTIFASIVLLTTYWTFTIMPNSLVYLFQRVFYYITGESFLLPTTLLVLEQDMKYLGARIQKGVSVLNTIINNRTSNINLEYPKLYDFNIKPVGPPL